MLTDIDFDVFVNSVMNLYTDYETSVIEDIARRLKNLDFASAAWQVQRLNESGALYKDILKKLSKLTGQSEAAIKEILTRAGVKAVKFDDAIYKAAGLNPLPLNMSPAMVQALKAALEKTNGVINNLTKTTVLNAQQTFIKAADLAYYQVSTGAMSYDQAIKQAVKKLASDGLEVVDYASGHRDKLDVAMRRAVLTGVAQTANTLQITRADELGSDLVAVSAHIGARNTGTGVENHEQWQGKIYSRSGTHPKYADFVKSTGYGTGEGLGGWNCRHSFYPFFEGLSENAYSRKELNEYASKTVTYQGKEMDFYTATQYQRGIERKIREWKRQEAALKAAGQDASFETGKVKQWQATMRDFINQTGLDRQSVREQIITSGGGSVAPAAPVTPIAPIVPEPPIVNNAVVPGIPVSNALDISTIKNVDTKKQVNLAIETINKIHGDGNLPTIPIEQTGRGRNYGTYYSTGNAPLKITINNSGDHKALTTLHEIGHFIDHTGLPNSRWSSRQLNGIENNLIVKINRESDWYKTIWEKFDEAQRKLAEKFKDASYIPKLSRKYVNYLMQSHEVFARAYAQFIAMESGDPILLAQLRALQNADIPSQWTDEDFKPIAEAFRELFKQRGWM